MATRRRRRGTGLFLVKAPKTGIYQIRGVVFGRSIRESTRTCDLAMADALRLRMEHDLKQRAVHGDQAVATFAEAFNDYMDNGGSGEFTKPLLLRFGNTKLADIDQVAVQKFIQETCKGNVGSSINRKVYTPLIAIMRFAAHNKKCAMPVFRRMKAVKKMNKHAPDEWITAFLRGCSMPNLKALVLLLTTTGVRVGEACRIQWVNIDLVRKTAFVDRTKNGEPRMLPLIDELVPLLVDLEVSAKELKYVDARVFRFADRTSVNGAIARECRRMGLPYYTTHQLGRHAIATRMLNAGCTIKETADAVGWKSLHLVHDTYGHLERSKVQKAMLGASSGLVLGASTQSNDNRPPEMPVKSGGSASLQRKLKVKETE